jgi:hypothetical protein
MASSQLSKIYGNAKTRSETKAAIMSPTHSVSGLTYYILA